MQEPHTRILTTETPRVDLEIPDEPSINYRSSVIKYSTQKIKMDLSTLNSKSTTEDTEECFSKQLTKYKFKANSVSTRLNSANQYFSNSLEIEKKNFGGISECDVKSLVRNLAINFDERKLKDVIYYHSGVEKLKKK